MTTAQQRKADERENTIRHILKSYPGGEWGDGAIAFLLRIIDRERAKARKKGKT